MSDPTETCQCGHVLDEHEDFGLQRCIVEQPNDNDPRRTDQCDCIAFEASS